MRSAHANSMSRDAPIGLLALLVLAISSGCSGNVELETRYGRRTSGLAQRSVNGTDVFAQMFTDAGHRVTNWRRLSPGLDGKRRREDNRRDADKAYRTIVWFPDDFGAPTLKQIDFLDDWLDNGGTLIYVGRDFDAEIQYWNTVASQQKGADLVEGIRRKAQAQARHTTERMSMPVQGATPWFVLRRDQPLKRIRKVSGPWAKNVKGEVDILVQGRLTIPTRTDIDAFEKDLAADPGEYDIDHPEGEVLLESNGVPLVYRMSRPDWRGGQVIVVNNGSFLLNLPLLKSSHQQIAQEIVGECSVGRTAFLSSDEGGPVV